MSVLGTLKHIRYLKKFRKLKDKPKNEKNLVLKMTKDDPCAEDELFTLISELSRP